MKRSSVGHTLTRQTTSLGHFVVVVSRSCEIPIAFVKDGAVSPKSKEIRKGQLKHLLYAFRLISDRSESQLGTLQSKKKPHYFKDNHGPNFSKIHHKRVLDWKYTDSLF